MNRFLILLIISASMLGCVNGPLKGFSGMAEHHLGTLLSSGVSMGQEHGLSFETELISRHLDVLVLEGAELCFPAIVVQAKLRQNRIVRELHGGLEYDAVNDIIIQRRLLARLERRLNYVKHHNVCDFQVIEGDTIPGEIGKKIDSLLNSKDKFSVNSADLNYSYIGQLAEAVQFLNDEPVYTLQISGHVSTLDQQNQGLSIQRAKKVGRYLLILGLPADRIQIDTVNINHAPFNDKQSELNLNNHRVSIELIKNPNPAMLISPRQAKE